MTQTNAQAALQAAATAMQGRQFASDAGSVTGLADKYLVWLDSKGSVDKERLIEYDLPRAEDRALKPSSKGHPDNEPAKPWTYWELFMRPRNVQAEWITVRVRAHDRDSATSRALAMYPGHDWANVTDTGIPAPQ